jgi:ubiquinone/menaquinone biosynthesis C-methylase UbiE
MQYGSGFGAKTTEYSEQKQVNDYFQSSASYWNDIYFDGRLWPTIYRERQNKALRWIDELRLPSSTRLLEIGCGAGYLSIALAKKGYSIDAMDSTPAMVELAKEHVSEAGVAAQVRIRHGDAHALLARDNTYDLVIALGVIPWLHSEQKAICEFHRVISDGGHLLMTADNDLRLNQLLDPLACPLLKPLRTGAKWILRRGGEQIESGPFQPKRHYPARIERMLESSGLKKVKSCSIGFGVLTLAGKQIIPNGLAVAIHRHLQKLADANVFPFRQTGLHYMILSEKL